MSLYNMMHGANPACFFILPMLGKHPDEYPRFRDCFINDPEHPEHNGKILVYTRVGGGNRGGGYGEEALMADPNFVTTYDDSYDSTFGMYVFNVPEQWKADFAILTGGEKTLVDVSEAYQRQCRKVYPKLREKFNELWPATFEAADAPVEAITATE